MLAGTADKSTIWETLDSCSLHMFKYYLVVSQSSSMWTSHIQTTLLWRELHLPVSHVLKKGTQPRNLPWFTVDCLLLCYMCICAVVRVSYTCTELWEYTREAWCKLEIKHWGFFTPQSLSLWCKTVASLHSLHFISFSARINNYHFWHVLYITMQLLGKHLAVVHFLFSSIL